MKKVNPMKRKRSEEKACVEGNRGRCGEGVNGNEKPPVQLRMTRKRSKELMAADMLSSIAV